MIDYFNSKITTKLILFLLLFTFCGQNTKTTSENLTTTTEVTTTTTEVITTTTTTPSVVKEEEVIDENYLDVSYSPGFSPNKLMQYEEDVKWLYQPETRNSLVKDIVINNSISETTEYKNTVIFIDDEICQNDEWIIEQASSENLTAEEYCNKAVKVTSYNNVRVPYFMDTIDEKYQNTLFDANPLGKCTEDLNSQLYDFASSFSYEFYLWTQEGKDDGFKEWHRDQFFGDFQIFYISPRKKNVNEEIIYNDSIYISTNYPTYMFFYLDEIEAQNDNLGFISILFSFSRYYSGAANVNYFNETFNYDLVNCRRIFLDDIFSNKNLSKELKITEKEEEITLPQSYSKETLSSWKNKSSPEWSFALSYEFSKVMCLIDNDFCSWTDSAIYSAPDLEFYKDFLIDREGIAFVFDKYQISCGGCNSPHPRILYKRLYRIIDFSKLGK